MMPLESGSRSRKASARIEITPRMIHVVGVTLVVSGAFHTADVSEAGTMVSAAMGRGAAVLPFTATIRGALVGVGVAGWAVTWGSAAAVVGVAQATGS